MTPLPPLILASASPRRRELLRLLGYPFRAVPSNAPEPPFTGGDPAEYAVELARAKARQVAAGRKRPAAVLGADTVVVLDQQVFGKPRDEAEAAAMLRALSGRTHRVITGLVLIDPGAGEEAAAVQTAVTFRPLTPEQIARYVATGEPLDKAGAYAIQGRGAALVTGLEGCYFNVVGLPVATVAEMLARRGYPVL
ncbi:MAG: Maf family protein [Bacillota bacterium]|nr:Maf family protein [Bacillota bacterium]